MTFKFQRFTSFNVNVFKVITLTLTHVTLISKKHRVKRFIVMAKGKSVWSYKMLKMGKIILIALNIKDAFRNMTRV